MVAKLLEQADNLEEQLPALIVKTRARSGLREALARKAGVQYINGLKTVASNGHVTNVFVQ